MAQATITITGNVGKEPTQRETATGKVYWTFSIGSTPRTKKDGEWTDGETMWFTVSVFGSIAGISVGTPVLVTGTFTQKSYTDKEGKPATANYINADTIAIIPKRETQESVFTNPTVNNEALWTDTVSADLSDAPF